MFDIRWIRENPEAFDAGLKRRREEPCAQELIGLDAVRREALSTAQEIQTRRNTISKQIGALKAKGEDASEIIAQVAEAKETQGIAERSASLAQKVLETALVRIPNLPADDVPEGADETDNVEIRKHGTPPSLDFEAKEHFELGEALGLMDFEAASRMSGARFVVLKGPLARLQRALGAFMLDLQTNEAGYTEVVPPYLVRDQALFGTGQLPKFKDDLFSTPSLRDVDSFWADYDLAHNAQLEDFRNTRPEKDEIRKKSLERQREWHQRLFSEEYDSPLWLIPTAEVPLTNLVREQILAADELPLRFTALTPCFRSEAGSAGKDTHGMIRQHQFDKVELVSIVHPDESQAEHERMTEAAEEVLKRLDLPYRVVVLATGDLGFSAQKTYDIEVWLPGQNQYREISSCSNCGDFQARRLQARFRTKGEEKGTQFVHTLNGSGLAVGRTLIAVMENGQTADGRISIPEALRPYMGGVEEIGLEA